MHETIMAVAKLVEENAELKRKLESAQRDADILKNGAMDGLRKQMEKALVDSDIKREVALARLEAYEKMNSKDDEKKQVMEMLKLAIQGLGTQPVVVAK